MKNNKEKIHKNTILFSNDSWNIIIACTQSVQELEKRKVYKLLISKLERQA